MTKEEIRNRLHRRKNKAIIENLIGRVVPCDSCCDLSCTRLQRFNECLKQEDKAAHLQAWRERRIARMNRSGKLPWE